MALQELATDNERLRLSASSARETAARQAEELSRLQRDNARMSSALVSTAQPMPACLPACLCKQMLHARHCRCTCLQPRVHLGSRVQSM